MCRILLPFWHSIDECFRKLLSGAFRIFSLTYFSIFTREVAKVKWQLNRTIRYAPQDIFLHFFHSYHSLQPMLKLRLDSAVLLFALTHCQHKYLLKVAQRISLFQSNNFIKTFFSRSLNSFGHFEWKPLCVLPWLFTVFFVSIQMFPFEFVINFNISKICRLAVFPLFIYESFLSLHEIKTYLLFI